MTAGPGLRTAVIGLLGLAATEERVLLTAAPVGESGSPECWAALPVLAHNTEFRQQQVQRLRAIGLGQVPPDFAATAAYVGAPDQARGMASYSLACVQAQAGWPEQASATLLEAIRLNPDLRANASRDPDLAVLRARPEVGAVIAA